MVVDFEHLIEGCTNHPKDRHVLAAAIHSKATHLLTYNTKDFAVDLAIIQVVQPADFFISVFELHTETVVQVLLGISQRTSRPMEEVLGRFAWTIRGFSDAVADYLNIEVVDIPPREWRRR